MSSDYLKNQINKYKKRSKKSFEIAQAFAVRNDLNLNLNMIPKKSLDIDSIDNISVVEQTTLAQKKIRLLKEQLKNLNSIENISEKNIFLSSEIIEKDEKNISILEPIIQKISILDNDLNRLRISFKENDRAIQAKLRYRENLIKSLNLNLKEIINAKLKDAEAIIKSNQRGDGVLAEFRLLKIQALKDNQILNQLETQYRFVLLEKAQNKDPWELITKPTLSEKPISPRKRNYVAFGLIGGLIIGISYSLFESKKKNIIFSESDLDSFDAVTLLGNLQMNKEKAWEETLDFIISGPVKKAKKEVAFLLVDCINNKSITKIREYLKNKIKDKNLLLTNDLREAGSYSDVIFLVEIGFTKKTNLQEKYNKISMQENSILGLITIDNN